jgi:hypothetical protein
MNESNEILAALIRSLLNERDSYKAASEKLEMWKKNAERALKEYGAQVPIYE